MFVSGDVARCVHYVLAPGPALPAACVVEALLMCPSVLGSVGQAAHSRRRNGPLQQKKDNLSLKKIRHIEIERLLSFFNHTLSPEVIFKQFW